MYARTLVAALVAAAAVAAPSASDQAPASADAPVRVLILTGDGTHNWRDTAWMLRQTLGDPGCFTCTIDMQPERLSAEALSGYDCIVTDYCGPRPGATAEAALTSFVERGGGLVVLHAAVAAFPGWNAYAQLVGAGATQVTGAGLIRAFPVRVVDGAHPVTQDVRDFQQSADELWDGLKLAPEAHILAQAYSAPADAGSGRDEPVCWTLERGRGRVFVLTLGHDARAYGIAYKLLIRRAVEWSGRGRVTTPVPRVWPLAGMPEAQLQGFVTSWYVTGPWPSPNKAGFDQAFPPEDGVDLAATYSVKTGDQTTDVGWKWVEGSPADGQIDLDAAFGHLENIAIYAYTEVTVDEAQDILLKVGSDDGVVVFLNGQKIHANNASRGVVVDQDVIEARLEAGTNRLLFKVLQGGGLWGLVARITDRQNNPIMFNLRTGKKPEDLR